MPSRLSSTRWAQKRVEQRNYEIRKNLLKYDDVVNDQRKAVYELRDELMTAQDVTPLLDDWPKENLQKMLETGGVLQPKEIAEAVMFMLTRPREVTIRDIVILPQNQDI